MNEKNLFFFFFHSNLCWVIAVIQEKKSPEIKTEALDSATLLQCIRSAYSHAAFVKLKAIMKWYRNYLVQSGIKNINFRQDVRKK